MSKISDSDYKILTGANVKWESNTHYRAMLEFAISCCEFMDNQGDLDFIITLPVNMEEFHQQLPQIKDRYILIIKSHIAHFETEPDKILTGDKADALEQTRLESLQRIGSELPEEIDNMKSSLMYESPPEDVSKTKEKYSVRYKAPPPVIDNEAVVRTKKIKELSAKVKAQALIIKSGRPDEMQMKIHIDNCRKINGKCNDSAVGRLLGIDSETAKRWIQNLGLSEYAYNPKHLK